MPSCDFILPDNTTCHAHTARGSKCGKHKTRQKCIRCPGTASKNYLCAKHYAIENDKYCSECENHAQYKSYTKCYTHSKTSGTKPKCLSEHCNKFAQSPSKYCCNHAMEITGVSTSQQCSKDECKNNALRGGFCTTHGKENGIESLKCISEGCANNRKKGGYCKKHGNERGIKLDIGCPHGKTQQAFCQICDQSKHPNMWCKECKTKCLRPGKRYEIWDGYCFDCYRTTFPSKITRVFQCRELAMRDVISKSFPDIDIIFDKRIDGGRSGRRPDVLIQCDTHCVIIECDENQHKKHSNYSDEKQRMIDISRDLGDKHVVFIRFNPDSYNAIPSCFTKRGKIRETSNDDWKFRCSTLIDTIKEQLSFQPTENGEIICLFYDDDNVEPYNTNVVEKRSIRHADHFISQTITAELIENVSTSMMPIIAKHFDILTIDDLPEQLHSCKYIIMDMADFYIAIKIVGSSSIIKMSKQCECDNIKMVAEALDAPVVFLYVNINSYKANGKDIRGISTNMTISKETKYREKGESVFENRLVGITNCCYKLLESSINKSMVCYLFCADYDAQNLTMRTL
jgi:hypothetical protein